MRLWSRSMADTPNRFTVEFQDAFNEYQQDSFSLVDADDVARSGQEIATTLPALGLPNYDQAARILKFNLDKSIRGNTYVEFETSVKAFGLQPGRPDHAHLSERRLAAAAVPGSEDRAGSRTTGLRRSRRRFTTIRGTPTATGKQIRAPEAGGRATPESAFRGR